MAAVRMVNTLMVYSTPMTRDSRAASTTSLVTTESWLMSRTRLIWAIRRAVSRKLPLVMRMIVAKASAVVKSSGSCRPSSG